MCDAAYRRTLIHYGALGLFVLRLLYFDLTASVHGSKVNRFLN
ncbi:hypothetical protein NOR53_582 [gamma proteobacterium NOR5-3]|nr:hypothetical protein NOR53_582 [gamma proteobacterium NOR5-3]